MITTTQFISVVLILLTMVVSVVLTAEIRRRKRQFPLRDIAAYEAIPLMVGESIEANRPVHLSLGSAGIGGNSTMLALVGAELCYQITRQAAIGDMPPILTLSDATALPLGQDTLRRAYQSRGLVERFRYSSVRWYPAGTRSLALAAGLTGLIGDDRATSNVLVGSFGPEMALVLEAGARRNLSSIATSDQLEGQAVAYVMAENALLGEEVFTAGAYLGGTPSQVAGVVTIDVLRWVLIVAMLVMMLAVIFRGG